MKGMTNIYITFLVSAVVMAVLLVVGWKSAFSSDDAEASATAKAWSSFLFLGGLFLLCLGVLVYYITGSYGYSTAVIHGIGVGLVLAMIMVGSFDLRSIGSSQIVFFSGISVIVVAVVIGLLGAVNYIAVQRSKKFDFNLNKLESLSDKSRKVVEKLSGKVNVVGFFYEEQRNLELRVRNFLEKYRSINRDKFRVRMVNPLKDPQMAECYGVKEGKGNQVNNRLVISRGKCVQKGKKTAFQGKKIVIKRLNEQEFTNQLIKVTRQGQKEICFLAGRMQAKIDDKQGRYGYGMFNDLLKEKGFKTRTVDLVSRKEVPPSCTVVINAAPEAGLVMRQRLGDDVARLTDAEVEMLEAYLKKGGKMMIFQEPMLKTNLATLLKKYGITWSPNLVVDFAINYRETPMMPMAVQFSSAHEITKGFAGRFRALFQWASSVNVDAGSPPGVKATALAKTARVRFRIPGASGKKSCCSFSVPDPSDRGFLQLLRLSRNWRRNTLLFNVAQGLVQKSIKDVKEGPFTLAAAATKKHKGSSKEARLVVFGDSAVGANVLIRFNQNLVMNSLAWLAQERDLVHIPTKRRKPSRIFLTSTQRNFINYTTSYGMPVFFLFIILFVVVVRRQQ